MEKISTERDIKALEAYLKRGKEIEDIDEFIGDRRLKELENDGLITKHIDATSFPVKSEYALTKVGLDFIGIIKDIKSWALRWKIHNKLCEQLDCKDCDL